MCLFFGKKLYNLNVVLEDFNPLTKPADDIASSVFFNKEYAVTEKGYLLNGQNPKLQIMDIYLLPGETSNLIGLLSLSFNNKGKFCNSCNKRVHAHLKNNDSLAIIFDSNKNRMKIEDFMKHSYD
jgi:hypothetical protein